jgi:hypothetical protein
MYSRGYYHDGLEEVYNKKFAELIVEDMHLEAVAFILITDVVMEEKGQVPFPKTVSGNQ